MENLRPSHSDSSLESDRGPPQTDSNEESNINTKDPIFLSPSDSSSLSVESNENKFSSPSPSDEGSEFQPTEDTSSLDDEEVFGEWAPPTPPGSSSKAAGKKRARNELETELEEDEACNTSTETILEPGMPQDAEVSFVNSWCVDCN